MEYYIPNFSTSTEGVNPSVVCHVVFDRSPERTKKTLALTRAFSVFSTHYRRGWDEGVCCTLRPLDATKITTQWTIKVKPKTMQTSSSVNERSECNLSPKRLQTSAGTSRGFLLHTRTRTQTLSGLFPPRPCPSSPHAALSARRDTVGAVSERLASLQRLSRIFHWETAGWQAGWMVAGKHARQQTTTPALHNSYGEGGGGQKKTSTLNGD